MADGLRPNSPASTDEGQDHPFRERRLTVGEFVRMGELGFFDEPGKHELWDGRVMMAPLPGPPHMDREARIVEALILALNEAALLKQSFRVQTGGGVKIGEYNLRGPDVMVVRLPFDTEKLLTGAGVALVIEIAHSSLPDDLSEKRGKYAGPGIEEYWVVDAANGRLYPFRHPKAGDYPDCAPPEAGAGVSPLFAPQITLQVADLV
jgi:Uma2 family endonuclease